MVGTLNKPGPSLVCRQVNSTTASCRRRTTRSGWRDGSQERRSSSRATH